MSEENKKIESETKQDMHPKNKGMADFDKELDETAKVPEPKKTVPEPKKRTPEEMKKNPLDALDEGQSNTLEQQQRKLDRTWQSEYGEPVIGHDSQTRPAPGSGASEGRGTHDSSINDNDSKNGPVR